MSTIITKKLSSKDLIDSNVVKVLVDENQNAINFKREVFDMEIEAVQTYWDIWVSQKDFIPLLFIVALRTRIKI